MKWIILSCVVCSLSACSTGKYSDTTIDPVCVELSSKYLLNTPGCQIQRHRVGDWASYALTTVKTDVYNDCSRRETGFGEQIFVYDPLFITDDASYDVLMGWSWGSIRASKHFGGRNDFGIYVNRIVGQHALSSGGKFNVHVVPRPGQLTGEFARLVAAGPTTISFQFKGGTSVVADASDPSGFYIGDLSLRVKNSNMELMSYLFIKEQPSSLLIITISHPDTDETYNGTIDFRDARPAFWAGQESLTSLLELGCAK